MIRINLLSVRAAQRKDQLRLHLIVLGLSLVLVAGGCAAVYASMASKITAENEAIARTQDELNQLRRTLGEVAQYKKLQGELEGKLDVLAKLQSARSGPVRLLDELSSALPERLWLTSFRETGGSITISGVGLDERTVAELMRNLERSPFYSNVELRVIEQTTQGDQRLHRFDLTCRAVSSAATPSAAPARASARGGR